MRYRSLYILLGTYLLIAFAFAACKSEEETEVKFSSELIKLTDTSIELSKEASTRSISVEADCDWDVTVSGSNWSDLVVQKTSANSFSITTDENPLREERTAVVTITTKGGLKKTISARQAKGDAYIRTDVQNNIEFDETGGTRSFHIQSNTSWVISVSYTAGADGWLQIGTTEGSSNQTITVDASKAITDQERQASITISPTEEGVSASASLTVKQSGLSFIELEVGTEQILFNSITGGEGKNIEITKSNAQWWLLLQAIDPENDLSWITLSKDSDIGSSSIKVTCTDNDTPRLRRAVAIIISGNKNGGSKKQVSITQEAGKLPEISDFALTTTGYILDATEFAFSYKSEFPVTEYGLCYSTTNQTPTIDDEVLKQTGNQTSGQDVNLKLTNMEPRKDYYLRAYAKSNVGIAYSTNILKVSTLGDAPNPGDNPRPF